MKYIVFLFIWMASCHLTVAVQEEMPVDSNAIVTNSLWVTVQTLNLEATAILTSA